MAGIEGKKEKGKSEGVKILTLQVRDQGSPPNNEARYKI